MPFFQGDDQFAQNRKTRQLVAPVLDGHLDGPAAICLWFLAGTDCQNAGTDGVIARVDMVRLLPNVAVVDHLANLLVDVGLWHRPGHDCERCPAVKDGTFLFHDWFDMKYTPAAQVRVNRSKRQELKDPELIAQVWARDCVDPANPNTGSCRYCRVVVKRKDNRSEMDKRPHLDHVDPRKAIGIRNVVLACGKCNQKKGNRTPREAGMTLLPPPRPEPTNVDEQHGAGPTPGTGHVARQSESGSSRPTLPAGPVSEAPASPVSSSQHSPIRKVDQTIDRPPDQSDTTPISPRYQADSAVPGGRGPGQGEGQGVGRGLGKGDRSGSPQPAPPLESPAQARRRRRRARLAQQSQPEQQHQASEPLDAGAPPPGVQAPADGFGSPWHRWHGPPSPVTETDCATHGLPQPCWKCARPSEVSE